MKIIVLAGDGSKKIRGCWDSIHVVEVQEKSGGRNAHYKLTSTAMLWLQVNIYAYYTSIADIIGTEKSICYREVPSIQVSTIWSVHYGEI